MGAEAFEGMNLVEIADQQGIEPVDCFIDLVRKSDGRTLQLTYGYSSET